MIAADRSIVRIGPHRSIDPAADRHSTWQAGWCSLPPDRKTGIERKAKLWPETVSRTCEHWLQLRPKLPDSPEVFLTQHQPIHGSHRGNANPISRTGSATTCEQQGLHQPRARAATLFRHIFRTIADRCPRSLQPFALVMGHADRTIDGVYIEGIG